MAGFDADEELAREHDEDLSRVPENLDAYAHVEGLVGEEDELLEQAEETRTEEHRDRLHAIRRELDSVWETLRRRAERHGKPDS